MVHCKSHCISHTFILLLSIEQGFISHVLFYRAVCKGIGLFQDKYPEKGERVLR